MNTEVSLRFRSPIVQGLVLLLVGGWFALGGVYFASIAANEVAMACEAAFWPKVSADLVSVGDDGRGKSPKVLATYRYRFAGREYENDRIAIATPNDNLSSYRETLQEELERAWRAEEPVPCFVDPDDPTRSLLDRRLRPWLLLISSPFWAGFTLCGGAAVIGGLRVIGDAAQRSVRRYREPQRPWLWRGDWASGEIRSHDPAVLMAAVFAAVWNLIFWPLVFLAWFFPNPFSPGWVPWAVTVFVLIGWWIARKAFPPFWRHFDSCSSVLRLEGLRGQRGETLVGTIVAPSWLREAAEVKVELTCTKPIKVRREADSDRVEEKKTTHAAATVGKLDRLVAGYGELRSDQIAVPIELLIPGGGVAPPTDPRGVRWRLEASAKTPGRAYEAIFEVPVF